MAGRPLRVLHVLTSAHRRGAESGAVALDHALRARGVQSEAVALTPAAHGTALDIEVLGRRSLFPSTLVKLRSRGLLVDVVVAHGSRTLPASAIALTGTGVPFVYKNIGDTTFWSDTRAKRIRVRAGLRRSARIVALTPEAKQDLIGHHALTPSHVDVIPSWRSGAQFRPSPQGERDALRHSLGLPTRAPVAMVLGALAPEKRVDLTLAAALLVPGLHLLIVGDGPERRRLQELATSQLPGRAHFTGSVDAPERLLPAADILLLSSASEGVPGVVIEAGLCAIPAVAFDVGGVASVVLDGVTGRLVPFGDVTSMAAAVHEVVANRDELGRRAREEYLRSYDTQRVVDRWLEVLISVAAARVDAGDLGSTVDSREPL